MPPVDFLVNGFTGAGELLMIQQAYELGIAPSANCALLGAGMDTLYPGFWDTVAAILWPEQYATVKGLLKPAK